MTNAQPQEDVLEQLILESIEKATNAIAPTWPLDQSIAVNPLWGWIDSNFHQVALKLDKNANFKAFMGADYYQELLDTKKIESADILTCASEQGRDISVDDVLDFFKSPVREKTSSVLLSSYLEQSQGGIERVITNQISNFCAHFFDEQQAEWNLPKDAGLYTSWKSAVLEDKYLDSKFQAEKLLNLSDDPREAILTIVRELEIPAEQLTDSLTTCLLSIIGWASWCAYLKWSDDLESKEQSNDCLVDLLAVRLSWEYMLDDGVRGEGSDWFQWQLASQSDYDDTEVLYKSILQNAAELRYQKELTAKLNETKNKKKSAAGLAQAVFCIDVRSEVYRRSLERISDKVQTLGFAGFFGIPASYSPIGTSDERPQLPGLLSPQMKIVETTSSSNLDETVIRKRKDTLDAIKSLKFFKTLPVSSFTLVEAFGIFYLKNIFDNYLKRGKKTDYTSIGLSKDDLEAVKPRLQGIDLETRAGLAKNILQSMFLTKDFATFVFLVGHGSQSLNNPLASSLDCGACCGQSGELNARVLSSILNDTEVRKLLEKEGICIPSSTTFIAGLHNTTTDEISFYDVQALPKESVDAFEEAKSLFSKASEVTRLERAKDLNLEAGSSQDLLKKMSDRANDWSQTRPEWGLCNNSAFVVAKRYRTKELNLEGKSFLHEYDKSEDSEYKILEGIMTAPMIVTHWINMQYYSSTVDNKHFGSGNKVLHNVVGGNIGVLEGNEGDLRIGLSEQSIGYGEKNFHEPLRLSVLIDAPRVAISNIIERHDHIKNLADNNWLSIISIDSNDERAMKYGNGSWQHLE